MKNVYIYILLFVLISPMANAQFQLDGQLIQRGEFRNGFGRLIPEGQNPAAFVGQRARIQANYQYESIQFYMSVQDIRIWGDTPQLKITDNNLSVHEAWASIQLNPDWALKLGRQELNYDNFRFLGNLDWALQGRAHDFALVKYEKSNFKLHFGAGYNQTGQALAGNLYLQPNQYKTAQMLRLEDQLGDLQYSFLFWNDGRQFAQYDENGTLTASGVRYRQTLGLPTLKYPIGNNTLLSGFYYHQLGKDPQGKNVNAYDVNIQATHTLFSESASGKKLRVAGGLEILSGSADPTGNQNRSFSPMYGTNHLYNGYMDLFFVGGSHENNVGLQDFYLKSRYDFNSKLFVQADAHLFYSHADVIYAHENLNKRLGQEFDVSFGYLISDAVSLQGGYSHFFYTDSFQQIQNNGALKNTQNWSYLMLIVRPNMKNKFIGILF